MNPTHYLGEVRSLIEKNQLPAAFGQLKKLLEHSPQLSRVLEQSARHREVVLQIASGTATLADATARKGAIRQELLALLDEIEQQQQQPAMGKELQASISMVLELDRRKARFRLFLLAGTAILLLVVLTAGFLLALRDRIWPRAFVLTVLVHGSKGPDDRILRGQGEVMLDIGTARFNERINDEGEATFKEIPGSYLGDTARVSIAHEQPYRAVRPDSAYVLREGRAIYLEVALTGLDSVFGHVRDFVTGRPLGGVRVSYRNIATHSDEFGWYVLHIPSKAREKFIRLQFLHPGYSLEEVDSVAPHTNVPVSPSLHPEK